MKLGILADIHECADSLRGALKHFEEAGVDQVVVLGDICDRGDRINETVSLLCEAGAIGVCGNEDLPLCECSRAAAPVNMPPRVLDFMRSLRHRLEIDGCLFTHVDPWLDPADLPDVWWLKGAPDTADKASPSFDAAENHVMFVGHFHRWLAITPEGLVHWCGGQPLHLDADNRYLIVVAPVSQGQSAVFDTTALELTPFDN